LRNSRKTAAAVAALLSIGLIAAACGGDDDDAGETTTTAGGATTTAAGATTTEGGGATTTAAEGSAGGTITLAAEQEFDAYNNGTSGTNALKNSVVLNQVLPSTFIFDDTAALVMDDQFLESAELTSEDPQTVVYKVNPDAAWADGEAIDCDDFYLAWIANNGVIKAADGEATLFDTAGTTGYENIESVSCSEDGKEITTVYADPFGDWKSLFTQMMPAHIVENESGTADLQAAYEGAAGAITPEIEAVATFWNEGFIATDGQLKPDVMISGGPYNLADFVQGQSVTLERNDAYWGEPGKADSIVFRLIGEATAQPQALQNEEVQIIAPQPNPDLLEQLNAIDGITVQNFGSFTYEHLDFNFERPLMADPAVREAFAYCVPRQEIVDTLIKPLNPDAVVMNNRLFFPFQDQYEDTSGGKFNDVDIAAAKAALEAGGWTLNGDVYAKDGQNLEFSIGHIDPNPRRTNTVQLIISSCAEAGMKITDAPSATFFDDGGELETGNFDVALFAWVGSPLVSGSTSTFVPGGGNNQGNWVNDQMEGLFAQANAELDETAKAGIVNQIDTIIWEDLATIPLFQFAELVAASDKVQNVIANPTQQDITWNAQDWSLA
jgi:peptide/nickel transport system substrate-binding protein